MTPGERENEIAYRKTLFEKKFRNEGPGKCWPWTASKMSGGVGQFGMGRLFNNRPVSANVASWFFHFDSTFPLGGEMQVIHLCENLVCVNPNHLSAIPAKGGLGHWHALHVLNYLSDIYPETAQPLDQAKVMVLRAIQAKRKLAKSPA